MLVSGFKMTDTINFFFSFLFLELGKQVVLLKYKHFSVSPLNGLL